MTPAVALAALAEEELALVLDGRVDELEGLHTRREALMSRLTVTGLSATDVDALRHAAGLQQLVTMALTEKAAEVRAELAGLGRGRAAAHGYGRTGL